MLWRRQGSSPLFTEEFIKLELFRKEGVDNEICLPHSVFLLEEPKWEEEKEKNHLNGLLERRRSQSI